MLIQESANNIDGDLKNRLQMQSEIRNITEVSMLDNYETGDLCVAKSKKVPKAGQTCKSLNHLWRPLSVSNCHIDKLR